MVDFGTVLFNGLDTVSQIGITIGVLIAVGGVGMLILYFVGFRHTVIARMLSKGEKEGNAKYIKQFKARTKEKDGVTSWEIMIRPFKHVGKTAPPPQSIHITSKGKLFAECYMSEDDPEPRWLVDNGKTSASFSVFDTQERALHVEGVTRDLTRKKKNLLDVILQLAPMIGIIILVLGFFIFFENIAKPAQDMMAANKELMAQNAIISEQNARMLSVIAGKLDAGEIQLDQAFRTPPDVDTPGGG